MQKEQFETRIKELLPNMTEQAMDKWEDYAQYLLEEEEETSDFFTMPSMWSCVSLSSIRESRPQQDCSTTESSLCSIILNCAVRQRNSPRAGRWSRSAIIPLKMAATLPTRNTGNPHRRCRHSAASRSIHFSARCACNMLRFAALLCCLL